MPVAYDGICDACEFECEIEKPMADEFPTLCPACGDPVAFRQNYAGKSPNVQDLTPKTIGQQAERNRKLDGKDLHQEKAEKLLGPKGMEKVKAPTPWWRKPGSKPLKLSTLKDPTNYILTGEK